jgi:hypothetical protein
MNEVDWWMNIKRLVLSGCFFSLPSCWQWLRASCWLVWNLDVHLTWGSRFRTPCSTPPFGSVTVLSGSAAARATNSRSSFITVPSPFSRGTAQFRSDRLICGPVFIRTPCSEVMDIITAFYLRICWMRYYYSRILRVT